MLPGMSSSYTINKKKLSKLPDLGLLFEKKKKWALAMSTWQKKEVGQESKVSDLRDDCQTSIL